MLLTAFVLASADTLIGEEGLVGVSVLPEDAGVPTTSQPGTTREFSVFHALLPIREFRAIRPWAAARAGEAVKEI